MSSSCPARPHVTHTLAEFQSSNPEVLRSALLREGAERRRLECLVKIQTGAVELALDLLVREPDVTGFFGQFTRRLVELCESHACGVWLIDDRQTKCELWMAYLVDHLYTRQSPDWETLALPRDSMSAHLFSYRAGWTDTVEYAGDDARLPAEVREFNRRAGVRSVAVAPLVLGGRNLGWIGLSTFDSDACESQWRLALLEAIARQSTLALHQSRLAEQNVIEERRKAVLEERNRLAREIHDNLAQGFAAILMQLQGAQREGSALPAALASTLDTAVQLARTHMIEARRSVLALRPPVGSHEDVGAALKRVASLTQRTTDVPIHLEIDELPRFGDGVEREIVGIAQEALSNAVRHARARRITVRATTAQSIGFRLSIADDGRGIARETRGAGFGMTSMRERAERIGASLTIVTAPRSGTEVVLAREPSSLPTQVHVLS
jgi:signal transduction histidine kinase